jgi:hypothetical protein
MTLRGLKPILGAVFLSVVFAGTANALPIAPPALSEAADPTGHTTELLPNSSYFYNSPGINAGTSIDQFFYFSPNSLDGPAAGTIFASFLPSQGLFEGLTLRWYVDAGALGATTATDTLMGTLPIGPLNSGPLVLALVEGVNYYARVTGAVAAGGDPGVFGFNLRTTPIPPALLLFGSALAGLGLLGRRSRRSAPTPLA